MLGENDGQFEAHRDAEGSPNVDPPEREQMAAGATAPIHRRRRPPLDATNV